MFRGFAFSLAIFFTTLIPAPANSAQSGLQRYCVLNVGQGDSSETIEARFVQDVAYQLQKWSIEGCDHSRVLISYGADTPVQGLRPPRTVGQYLHDLLPDMPPLSIQPSSVKNFTAVVNEISAQAKKSEMKTELNLLIGNHGNPQGAMMAENENLTTPVLRSLYQTLSKAGVSRSTLHIYCYGGKQLAADNYAENFEENPSSGSSPSASGCGVSLANDIVGYTGPKLPHDEDLVEIEKYRNEIGRWKEFISTIPKRTQPKKPKPTESDMLYEDSLENERIKHMDQYLDLVFNQYTTSSQRLLQDVYSEISKEHIQLNKSATNIGLCSAVDPLLLLEEKKQKQLEDVWKESAGFVAGGMSWIIRQPNPGSSIPKVFEDLEIPYHEEERRWMESDAVYRAMDVYIRKRAAKILTTCDPKYPEIQVSCQDLKNIEKAVKELEEKEVKSAPGIDRDKLRLALQEKRKEFRQKETENLTLLKGRSLVYDPKRGGNPKDSVEEDIRQFKLRYPEDANPLKGDRKMLSEDLLNSSVHRILQVYYRQMSKAAFYDAYKARLDSAERQKKGYVLLYSDPGKFVSGLNISPEKKKALAEKIRVARLRYEQLLVCEQEHTI
jgi:hypothetical protein